VQEQIAMIVGIPEVDCFVDCVGFEASGHGADAGKEKAVVLNQAMAITRAGGSIGIPGCT
jgi:glutathione-independent formaldehyde dehydrogenase